MSIQSSGYKLFGYFLTFSGPLLLLIFALFFLESSYVEGSSEILNALSSVIALVGFLLTLLAPIGIVFLVRRDSRTMSEAIQIARTKPEYVNLTDEQIVYIHEWSWGAFFGNFVWPAGEKLYGWMVGMFFGFVFPLVPLVLSYILGKNGRLLSWKKGWVSFDEFKRRQKLMTWFSGISFAVLLIIGFVVGSVISASISEGDQFGIQKVYENMIGENDKYTLSYYEAHQERVKQINEDKTAQWLPVWVTLEKAKVLLINDANDTPTCLTVLTGSYNVDGVYYDYEKLFLSDKSDGEKKSDNCAFEESSYGPMLGWARSPYYYNANNPSIMSEVGPVLEN